jgi:hypothetical protein
MKIGVTIAFSQHTPVGYIAEAAQLVESLTAAFRATRKVCSIRSAR